MKRGLFYLAFSKNIKFQDFRLPKENFFKVNKSHRIKKKLLMKINLKKLFETPEVSLATQFHMIDNRSIFQNENIV